MVEIILKHGTREEWDRWQASRDKYDDRQDWYDARPKPMPGAIEEGLRRMAEIEAKRKSWRDEQDERLAAMSELRPVEGEIVRSPSPYWRNKA